MSQKDHHQPNHIGALSFAQHERDSMNGFVSRLAFSNWFDRLITQRVLHLETKPLAIFLLDPGYAKLDLNLEEDNVDLLEDNLWKQLRFFEQQGFVVASFSLNRFILVLPECEDVSAIQQIAEQIVYMVSSPLHLFGEEFSLNPALGVCHFPAHGNTSKTLIAACKAALLIASEGSRGLAIYDTTLGLQCQLEANLKSHLENALHEFVETIQAEEELMFFDAPNDTTKTSKIAFKILYSPVVHLQSSTVEMLESFLVWQDNDGKIYTSEEIFDVLENHIHSSKLLHWWWRQSCIEFKKNKEKGIGIQRLMLKFEKIQTHQRKFAQWFKDFMQNEKIHGDQLVLGVNEKILVHDQKQFFDEIKIISSFNVNIAIQKFGAGGVSLTSLQKYPIDFIQIDPEFIRDIYLNADNYAMVRSILSIANWLNIPVMVTGIDSEEQSALLLRDRCYLQSGSWFHAFQPIESLNQCLVDMTFLQKMQAGQKQEIEQTILLLDDEAHILSALKRLLRRENYRILSTTNSKEAFELLAKHHVDVIISDQRMPEMTGTEFLSKVKDLYPTTIRIVLSGYTELQSVTEAINQGAIYKFLTKPWDDNQLVANIREAFRRLGMERENVRLRESLEKVNIQLLNTNEQLELQLRHRLTRVERELEKIDMSHNILHYLPLSVVSVDENGNVISVNQRAQQWLGQDQQKLLGRAANEVLPEPLIQALLLFNNSQELTLHWKTPQGFDLDVTLQKIGVYKDKQGVLFVIQHPENT